jgi:gas vesicle protein
MRSNGALLVGLVAGTLAGASLAMLLTPAPADEMRQRLRAKARQSPPNPPQS